MTNKFRKVSYFILFSLLTSPCSTKPTNNFTILMPTLKHSCDLPLYSLHSSGDTKTERRTKIKMAADYLLCRTANERERQEIAKVRQEFWQKAMKSRNQQRHRPNKTPLRRAPLTSMNALRWIIWPPH